MSLSGQAGSAAAFDHVLGIINKKLEEVQTQTEERLLEGLYDEIAKLSSLANDGWY